MGKKWWYFIFSLLIMVPGLIVLGIDGLRLGIDFIGGTVLEYKFEKSLDRGELEKTIQKIGIEVSSITPSSGTAYVIKLKPQDITKIIKIRKTLQEEYGQVEEIRSESIGPIIGGETTRNALIAIVLSSVMIVLYLSLAFRKVPKPASSFRFGITAVVALFHDVLVVLGIFAILGRFYHVELDVLFITALLTIIGFSVHDTIVVFDRIRENLQKHLSKKFIEVANLAVVETLARSLNTSLTVVFVLLATLLFGGESIRWFIVALLVGIVSGTYSSIFNATALLVLWEEKLGH